MKKDQFILAVTLGEATQIDSNKFVEVNKILNLKECRDVLESIREFNDRYLDYYCQLSTENKAKLLVYDYENSIYSQIDIYEKVDYEKAKTIEATCKIAKEVERIKLGSRLIQKCRKYNNNNIQNNYPFVNGYKPNQNFNQLNNNYSSFLNKNLNNELQRNSKKYNNNSNNNDLNSVDDITRGLENLHIKVCYWCHEPGHIIRYCPQLRYQQNNMKYSKN
ncbi:hypothetical protein U3516DRAFT_797977 [Neocallimastix sp. 'constans']